MDGIEEYLGYVIGKWYMVKIGYDNSVKDLLVPAKFLGIRRGACEKDHSCKAKCPGEAIFENIKPYDCGFKGVDWQKSWSSYISSQYLKMVAAYREVTLSEEWAVRAVEDFCKVLTGQQKSFNIPLNNGYHFVGQLKSPSVKENLSGRYRIEAINPATGEKKEGWIDYDGKSESPQAYILSKKPGIKILSCKPLFTGLSNSK